MARTLGSYVLDEQLGSGGTADVWSAVDRDTGTRVILKIAPADLDKKTLMRFMAETRIIAKLDHENIVRIVDVGSEGDTYYYAREYVDAEPLEAVLKRRFGAEQGIVRCEEILSLSLDVARALSHTHERRVFHRDIKPANILVRDDGRALLMDFGLAKTDDLDSLTKTGTLLGTPLYMSPEQLSGRKVDHRTDLYSLGLVMFRLATGQLPFQSNNPYTSAMRRMSEDVPLPSRQNPTLPPALERIILKLLQRDPGARFETADEVVAALERCERGEESGDEGAITVDRPPRDGNGEGRGGEATARASRPWGRRWLVGGALLAALAAAGIWALFGATTVKTTRIVLADFEFLPAPRTARIAFRLSKALRSELRWGRVGHMDRILILSKTPTLRHEGTLEDLQPDGDYAYQLRLIDETDRIILTPVTPFRSLPAPAPLADLVHGGTSSEIHEALSRLEANLDEARKSRAALGLLLDHRDEGVRKRASDLVKRLLTGAP